MSERRNFLVMPFLFMLIRRRFTRMNVINISHVLIRNLTSVPALQILSLGVLQTDGVQ
jgi:hypothetical protein